MEKEMINDDLRRKINFRKIVAKSCSNCISGYWELGLFYCYEHPEEIDFAAAKTSNYVCDLWGDK